MSTLKAVENDKTVLVAGSIKSAMKVAGAGSKDLWQVPVESFVVLPGFNPRIDTKQYKARIRRLADSIKTEGFYQAFPIGAFANESGQIIVRSGFTRLAAAKLAINEGAELETLPCVVSQSGLDDSDIAVSFIRDNEGAPLTIYETAVIVQRLTKFGHEPEVIAERLGFSEQHIQNLLGLMASPMKLKEMVANEVCSASLAIELIAKHGGEKALEKLIAAAEGVKENGKEKVTAKDVEEPGKAFRKACKKQGADLFNIITAICETDCFEKLDQKLYDKLSAVMAEIENVDDRSEAQVKAARAAVEAEDE